MNGFSMRKFTSFKIYELFVNHLGMVLALAKGPEHPKKTCKKCLKNKYKSWEF